MKSSGFLDDIEKVVDDFSPKDKKQINSHINSEIDWHKMLDDMQRQDYRESMDRFQREYLQENLGGWSSTTSPKNKDVFKCECGNEIEIFYIKDEHEIRTFDWRSDVRQLPVDEFHCPRCMQIIRVAGKITDLKVKMME